MPEGVTSNMRLSAVEFVNIVTISRLFGMRLKSTFSAEQDERQHSPTPDALRSRINGCCQPFAELKY
jgi:hypothetical protein